jgi:hypothetical protein
MNRFIVASCLLLVVAFGSVWASTRSVPRNDIAQGRLYPVYGWACGSGQPFGKGATIETPSAFCGL